MSIAAHVDGPLDAARLHEADVLVLAHPSDPRWERTVGGSPLLSDDELDAIEAFVHDGGGLIVLGEEEQDKYANNLNALLARFGIRIASDALSDYESNDGAPHWVLGELARSARDGVDLLARVRSACFYRAGRLELSNGAGVLARSSPTASVPGAALLAVTEHGAGRVVVAADSDLFGDDCIASRDHADLWCNLVLWAAGGAFRAAGDRRRVGRCRRPALGGAARRRRRHTHLPGAGRLDRPRDARPRRAGVRRRARRRGGRAACSRTSSTSASTSTRSSPTCRRGSPAASSARTSPRRSTRFTRSSVARTASSTSSSSGCTRRTARATRAWRRSSSASRGRPGSPTSSASASTTRSSSR